MKLTFGRKKTSRRIVPVVLATFIVVAAAVYCGAWYVQAMLAKEAVKHLIAQVNAKQQVITYSAIETSGFPGNVNVNIIKPKFATYASVETTVGKPPEWTEEVALDGMLTLSINALSNRFVLSLQGPITHTTSVDGVRGGMLTQIPGIFSCTLDLDRRQGLLTGLWDLKGLSLETADELKKEFRALQCGAPGYTITDIGSKEPAASAGQFALRLAIRPEWGDRRSIGFAAKAEDLEFTPRMNAALNARLASLYGSAGALPTVDIAAYGKQNIDIAFLMRGPADTAAFTTDTPFLISVPRLNISNALYTTASTLQLENRVDGTKRGVTFLLNSESNFSQAYDAYLTDYTHIVVARIKGSEDPGLAPLKDTLAPFTADQASELLAPAVPKLSSLGKISLQGNANLDGDTSLHKKKLAVSTMEISTAPYGVSLQGSAVLPDGKPPESTNFTLTCRNCLMLVDDVAHYQQRLQQALNALNHETTQPLLTPQMSQGIQTFLSTLGQKQRDKATGAEALAFTLVSDASGKLSLNGQSPQQVTELYNSTIAAAMPAEKTPKKEENPEEKAPAEAE